LGSGLSPTSRPDLTRLRPRPGLCESLLSAQPGSPRSSSATSSVLVAAVGAWTSAILIALLLRVALRNKGRNQSGRQQKRQGHSHCHLHRCPKRRPITSLVTSINLPTNSADWSSGDAYQRPHLRKPSGLSSAASLSIVEWRCVIASSGNRSWLYLVASRIPVISNCGGDFCGAWLRSVFPTD
jgi:hypothetical protein